MIEELSREEFLDKVEQTAYNYEQEYHGCARCTFCSLQEHLSLGNDSVFLASTPLSAGIAMRGETCGALLGGLLAIGLATASADMKDEVASRNTMAAGYFYVRRFVRELGSSQCRDIQMARLGRFFNIVDPNEYEAFAKAGGYNECPKVVGKAARIAAQLILEQQERAKASK